MCIGGAAIMVFSIVRIEGIEGTAKPLIGLLTLLGLPRLVCLPGLVGFVALLYPLALHNCKLHLPTTPTMPTMPGPTDPVGQSYRLLTLCRTPHARSATGQRERA